MQGCVLQTSIFWWSTAACLILHHPWLRWSLIILECAQTFSASTWAVRHTSWPCSSFSHTVFWIPEKSGMGCSVTGNRKLSTQKNRFVIVQVWAAQLEWLRLAWPKRFCKPSQIRLHWLYQQRTSLSTGRFVILISVWYLSAVYVGWHLLCSLCFLGVWG